MSAPRRKSSTDAMATKSPVSYSSVRVLRMRVLASSFSGVEIWCCRGGNVVPKRIERQAGGFNTATILSALVFEPSHSGGATYRYWASGLWSKHAKEGYTVWVWLFPGLRTPITSLRLLLCCVFFVFTHLLPYVVLMSFLAFVFTGLSVGRMALWAIKKHKN
ncbi:uncharacterized protein LACBIDRAFT_328580 [Laccaria bicolor S238N-H82]|uniref:Predicted protein n=1 Tax=Laccaria bicolor (strain S238N-H82 / ATCC MYA-4686) TaxID=486041 RepID=B0DFC1_LACBS|nr:uncharacterized protein LACBIDRAFT_328580 [Laccaria bicolor S238N-H82]EDR06679.1 predicted protein [Laccaria bicolor S238N-H82]|eukprot:XP_001882526.1 predicted protein [Laccaria bicolor S238N-H82]